MEPHMATQPNQKFLFATTEEHDNNIGMTEFCGFHLGPQQRRLKWAFRKLNIFIIRMGTRDGGDHGQHYRSCVTDWGWIEDENQPLYK